MPTIVRVAHFDVNLSRVLGEGGFGKVFRAKDISEDPPMECAAKQVTSMPEAELKKEVELMRWVGDHPSIIGFRHFEQVPDHETPEVRASSWIFMEMATGGELFDRLIDSGNLTERAVAPYFKGMVEGLLHCHARGVVHRDIKLENVMLCAEDPNAIKLVDFGLAVRMLSKADGGGGFEEGTLLYDKVGSKSYRAPEILAGCGYHATPVDVWALGITVFSLVSGFFPLDEAKESDWRYARMMREQARGVGPCESIYSMYQRQCPLSAELQELLDSMLATDPARRVAMPQVAEHRWFASGQAVQAEDAFTEDGDEVMYRSAGGDDDDDDNAPPPFERPEQAIPISRQRACLGDTLA